MKWTVLGCHSPFPGPGGATAGYLLETSAGPVLVDCGSGVVSQLMKLRVPWNLHAILLSHLHNDHVVDIPIYHYVLLMARLQGKRSAPMPLYAPGSPEPLAERLLYKDYIQYHKLNADSRLVIGDVSFEFFRTEHDVECYGFKASSQGKTIAYSADAGPNTDWSKLGTDMDLLVIEGTYLKKDVPDGPRGHLSVEEAAGVAEELKAKRCMITHIYPYYQPDDLIREARSRYTGTLDMARSGLSIEL